MMFRSRAIRFDALTSELLPKLLVLSILAAFLTGTAAVRAESPPGARSKVIFQVSDADQSKWNLTLNNVRNVQNDLGKDKVDIEIVAYGPGIAMLKADSLAGNRIEDATAAGVKVVACENTMKAQKLGRDDMLRGIDYVAAGVVELMQKQQQGYAYIRP